MPIGCLFFSQYLRDVKVIKILSDLSSISTLGVDNVQVSSQVSQQLHNSQIPVRRGVHCKAPFCVLMSAPALMTASNRAIFSA